MWTEYNEKIIKKNYSYSQVSSSSFLYHIVIIEIHPWMHCIHVKHQFLNNSWTAILPFHWVEYKKKLNKTPFEAKLNWVLEKILKFFIRRHFLFISISFFFQLQYKSHQTPATISICYWYGRCLNWLKIFFFQTKAKHILTHTYTHATWHIKTINQFFLQWKIYMGCNWKLKIISMSWSIY